MTDSEKAMDTKKEQMDRKHRITFYQKPFNRACRDGNLEEAKRLYQQNSDKINIHNYIPGIPGIHNECILRKYTEYPFIKSCAHGHFEVAKWLYDLGRTETARHGQIDIHARCEEAFRMSCANGHFEIAKWLVRLGQQETEQGQVDIHTLGDNVFRRVCERYRNTGNQKYLDFAKWLYSLAQKDTTERKGKSIDDMSEEEAIFNIGLMFGSLREELDYCISDCTDYTDEDTTNTYSCYYDDDEDDDDDSNDVEGLHIFELLQDETNFDLRCSHH